MGWEGGTLGRLLAANLVSAVGQSIARRKHPAAVVWIRLPEDRCSNERCGCIQPTGRFPHFAAYALLDPEAVRRDAETGVRQHRIVVSDSVLHARQQAGQQRLVDSA